MALYVSKITFTGDLEGKIRPKPRTIVVRAKDMSAAASRIAKYSRRFWRYYRFEIDILDCGKVLK